MLGHGSFTQNFTRENKRSTYLLGVFLRLFHHEDSAVDAWVHVSSITVLGLSHHFQILSPNVHDLERHAQLFCRFSCTTSAFFAQAKGTHEVHRFNLDALLEKHLS